MLAGLSISLAGGVVPELGEDPGAEHRTEPGGAGDDVSVRVPANPRTARSSSAGARRSVPSASARSIAARS